MSQRTWVCLTCRKSYRRSQEVLSLHCPRCDTVCEYVHSKIRIPSPRRLKAWEEFWEKYKAEKTLLAAFERGELRQNVELTILNMRLQAN